MPGPFPALMALLGALACARAPGEPALSLIPAPAYAEAKGGRLALGKAPAIWIDAAGMGYPALADYLARRLRDDEGIAASIRDRALEAEPPSAGILLAREGPEDPASEAYSLEVSEGRDGLALARVGAASARGCFYGIQSLLGLIEGGSLPALLIRDRPRFAWRGFMLDEARSFYGIDYVKRLIDQLAAHKYNVLHWHLSDDQGWRAEIKAYPRLTGVGAYRGQGASRYGGAYSQEELREVVAYAAGRFIQVLPEIDLPGHVTAALAAYPELSCRGGPFDVSQRWGVHQDVLCLGKDSALRFAEDVIGELLDIFPSACFHVGGDEVPKTRWKACPLCQARIDAEGLADEAALQAWFTARLAAFLSERGRILVGWDEIMEGGLPAGALVQVWRSEDRARLASLAGAAYIASPWEKTYLCYPLAKVSLETAYAFDPEAPRAAAVKARGEAAGPCLGLEAVFFSEGFYGVAAAEKAIWPRACALAEVAWSPAGREDFKDFQRRLAAHTASHPPLR